jgi:hypothetical protein
MPISERVAHDIVCNKFTESGADHIRSWETPAGKFQVRRHPDLIFAAVGFRAGNRALELSAALVS